MKQTKTTAHEKRPTYIDPFTKKREYVTSKTYIVFAKSPQRGWRGISFKTKNGARYFHDAFKKRLGWKATTTTVGALQRLDARLKKAEGHEK